MSDVALYEPVDPYPHDGSSRALTPEQMRWQEDAARLWHPAGVAIRAERQAEHLRRHHRTAALHAGLVKPESAADYELLADPALLALCSEMEQAVGRSLGVLSVWHHRRHVRQSSPEPYRSQGWYEDWADYMVRLMKRGRVAKRAQFERRLAAKYF